MDDPTCPNLKTFGEYKGFSHLNVETQQARIQINHNVPVALQFVYGFIFDGLIVGIRFEDVDSFPFSGFNPLIAFKGKLNPLV